MDIIIIIIVIGIILDIIASICFILLKIFCAIIDKFGFIGYLLDIGIIILFLRCVNII